MIPINLPKIYGTSETRKRKTPVFLKPMERKISLPIEYQICFSIQIREIELENQEIKKVKYFFQKPIKKMIIKNKKGRDEIQELTLKIIDIIKNKINSLTPNFL